MLSNLRLAGDFDQQVVNDDPKVLKFDPKVMGFDQNGVKGNPKVVKPDPKKVSFDQKVVNDDPNVLKLGVRKVKLGLQDAKLDGWKGSGRGWTRWRAEKEVAFGRHAVKWMQTRRLSFCRCQAFWQAAPGERPCFWASISGRNRVLQRFDDCVF